MPDEGLELVQGEFFVDAVLLFVDRFEQFHIQIRGFIFAELVLEQVGYMLTRRFVVLIYVIVDADDYITVNLGAEQVWIDRVAN